MSIARKFVTLTLILDTLDTSYSMIRLGTLFSGIGAIEQALLRMGEEHINVFACDNGEIDLKLFPLDDQKEYDRLRKIGSPAKFRV